MVTHWSRSSAPRSRRYSTLLCQSVSPEVRYGRGSGPWFDSATDFAALQLRYEVVYAWHALAEYRWLDVQAGGTRQGWLVGLDRDIGKNFRIGAGYNFTEFSDDLTDFDYDHEGWFLNMVGMY